MRAVLRLLGVRHQREQKARLNDRAGIRIDLWLGGAFTQLVDQEEVSDRMGFRILLTIPVHVHERGHPMRGEQVVPSSSDRFDCIERRPTLELLPRHFIAQFRNGPVEGQREAEQEELMGAFDQSFFASAAFADAWSIAFLSAAPRTLPTSVG